MAIDATAVWTLRIGKEEIPGRWVIIDRRFVAVEVASAWDRLGPRSQGPVASGEQ